jgi:hypothetical protein
MAANLGAAPARTRAKMKNLPQANRLANQRPPTKRRTESKKRYRAEQENSSFGLGEARQQLCLVLFCLKNI